MGLPRDYKHKLKGSEIPAQRLQEFGAWWVNPRGEH